METNYEIEKQKLSDLENYADILREQATESQVRIDSLEQEN